MVVPTFLARKPDQIGILVEDLAIGADTYGRLCGVESWSAFTFSPETLARLEYRGQAADFSMKLAFAGMGPQMEIIEPLTGPSIYTEWIETSGYGLHHLGYYVDSLENGIKEMEVYGLYPVQAGYGFGANKESGNFAYFEVPELAPVVIELIEPAKKRRTPESI